MTDSINQKILSKLRYCGRQIQPCKRQGQQRKILQLLVEKDALTPKDIASVLRITPPSVSELIYKLECKGLIQKKQNEIDRRNMNISLTELGRERIVGNAPLCESKFLSQAFIEFSMEEKEQLLEYLHKIINILDNNLCSCQKINRKKYQLEDGI